MMISKNVEWLPTVLVTAAIALAFIAPAHLPGTQAFWLVILSAVLVFLSWLWEREQAKRTQVVTRLAWEPQLGTHWQIALVRGGRWIYWEAAPNHIQALKRKQEFQDAIR